MKMPNGYYDRMFDIEALTHLNTNSTRQFPPEVDRSIVRIQKQDCTTALLELRQALVSNPPIPEVKMLISALWVKDVLFHGLVDEVKNRSPKSCALEELSRYLRKSQDQVESRMLVEEPVDAEWRRMKINPSKADDVVRFYKETDAYVYELMAANHIIQTLYTFSVMAERMRQLGVRKVLDYGGGAGTLAIFLSRLGFEVTYADLPGKTADFARWRFAQRGLRIPVTFLYGDEATDLHTSKLDQQYFDCILSTEVIEHVPNPLNLLQAFSNQLIKGDVLVISESCEFTEQFSSHLESNKQYGGDSFVEILKEQSFRPLEVEFFIPQQIYIKV